MTMYWLASFVTQLFSKMEIVWLLFIYSLTKDMVPASVGNVKGITDP